MRDFKVVFDALAPADADPDNDDHGIDVALPVTNPVRSPSISLAFDSEPTAGDSEDVTGTGRFSELDEKQ